MGRPTGTGMGDRTSGDDDASGGRIGILTTGGRAMGKPNEGWLYSVDEKHDDPAEAREYAMRVPESHWGEETTEYLAEGCAEHFHDRHDGWESSWPVVVHLYDADGVHQDACTVNKYEKTVFAADWIEGDSD